MEATERLKFGEVYANCEAEEVVNGYHAGWRIRFRWSRWYSWFRRILQYNGELY